MCGLADRVTTKKEVKIVYGLWVIDKVAEDRHGLHRNMKKKNGGILSRVTTKKEVKIVYRLWVIDYRKVAEDRHGMHGNVKKKNVRKNRRRGGNRAERK